MQKTGTHWASLGQFIVSSLTALLSLAIAGLLFLSGLFATFGPNGEPIAASIPVFNLAWAAGVVAVLMVPSAVFSLMRLQGSRPSLREWKGRYLFASALMLVWPLLVAVSSPLGQSGAAWLLLPPVMMLAIIIPIWWYLETGRRGLPVGRPQRTWGTVTFSTLVTVPLIITVEVVVIVFVVTGAAGWLSNRPDLVNRIGLLAQRLQTIDLSPELIERLATPFLNEPVFLFAALFVVAIFTPLVEELLKPLAIWLLPGLRLTPAQGFWLGMVCGATFALLETLGLAGSAGGADATSVLLARLSTGLLHVVTAGLTGWAIAATWGDGRYGRVVWAYLAAVLIHGLWNAFGVLVGFSPMVSAEQIRPDDPLLAALGQVALPVLIGLVAINLIVLIWFNRRLRRSEPGEPGMVETTAS